MTLGDELECSVLLLQWQLQLQLLFHLVAFVLVSVFLLRLSSFVAPLTVSVLLLAGTAFAALPLVFSFPLQLSSAEEVPLSFSITLKCHPHFIAFVCIYLKYP